MQPTIDDLWLVIAGADPELILVGVACTRSATLLQYARSWVSHVGRQFRAELHEAFGSSKAGGGSGVGLRPWHVSGGAEADVGRRGWIVTVRAPPNGNTKDGRSATLAQKVLLCAAHNLVIALIEEAAPPAADVTDGADADADVGASSAHFRCFAFQLDSVIDNMRRTGPFSVETFPSGPLKCVELLSARCALDRARAVSNVHTLSQPIRAALVPGDDGDDDVSGGDGNGAFGGGSAHDWGPLDKAGAARLAGLNEGQRAALAGLSGPVSMVRAPPASGTSRMIANVALHRVPPGATALICAINQRGADAIVREIEAAGLAALGGGGSAASASGELALHVPMITAGSAAEGAGENAARYSLPRRLELSPALSRAATELSVALEEKAAAVATCEKLRAAKKKRSAEKRPSESVEEDVLFVGRQAEKLASLSKLEQSKPARKTPGVGRLTSILVPQYLAPPAKEHLVPTPAELIEASRQYLQRPPDDEEQVTAEKTKKAKAKLQQASEAAVRCEQTEAAARVAARAKLWYDARVVVCVYEDAQQVAELILSDKRAATSHAAACDAAAPAAAESLASVGGAGTAPFDFVLIDRAGALSEPDALSCIRHGRRAVLLVGDQAQLPPSVRRHAGLPNETEAALRSSLFARLAASRRKLGDYGGTSHMLFEQYRMPHPICTMLGNAFYQGKLESAGEAATPHPMPFVLVDAGGTESRAKAAGSGEFINDKEAAAAARLVALYVSSLGAEPFQVCVACFHSAQKLLIASKLVESAAATNKSLKGVCVCTIDEMLHRSFDIVIISCVRAGAQGAAAAAGVGGGLGLLSDPRYVCTVLSRARASVVVFGSTRALAIDRIWRPMLTGLKRFASAESHESSVVEQVDTEWVRASREHANCARAAAASRRENEQSLVDAMQKARLTEVRRLAREAAGIVEPVKLKGWSSDAPGEPAPGGGEPKSSETVVEEPKSAEEELRVKVVRLVEAALDTATSANASSAAAAKAISDMTAVAEKVGLARLDCVQPLLLALLAPAAVDGGKKARLKISERRLNAGGALLSGIGAGALAHAALLAALQACCEAEPCLGEIFEHLLLQLYELPGEVMPEVAIFAWADGASRAPPGSSLQKLHAQSSAFLQWLKEAEEEDEDDD